MNKSTIHITYFLACYSDDDLNNGPFGNQALINHLNNRLVPNSDPHCNFEGHYDQLNMLKRFVEFGADLSADAHDQMTPLMSVCSTSCGHGQDKDVFEINLVECAKILFEKGKVDVNARQSQRLTALM